MSNGKIRTYKNPDRDKPLPYTPYVPQYTVLGIDPMPTHGSMGQIAKIVQTTQEPLPKDNPRAPRAAIRQPYAEAVPSPLGTGKGFLPNVGNNVEQTWSSLDGAIIDDLDFEEEINTGTFVPADPLPQPAAKTFLTKDDLKEVIDTEEDAYHYLQSLDEGDYILFINGDPICSGDLEAVQKETKSLVFGDHSLCGGNPIPIDDILVVKRVKLKVGLFLE